MTLDAFLEKLKVAPDTITFDLSMTVIQENYEFRETAFSNGETSNAAGQNNGSCKIFAFAYLNRLTQDQTLHCFGDYYRKDVLRNPHGDDHQNIRSFMLHGWQGVSFDGEVLIAK